MTEPSRLKWAQSSSRCLNCLRTGHATLNCTSKNRCSTCKKNHHSLLHIQKQSQFTQNYEQYKNATAQSKLADNSCIFAQNSSEYASTTNTQIFTIKKVQPSSTQTVQPSTNLRLFNINKSVLLATALIQVPDIYGIFHTFRALIDQGSEVSLITESAAQTLKLPKSKTSISISTLGENQQYSNSKMEFQMFSCNTNFNQRCSTK